MGRNWDLIVLNRTNNLPAGAVKIVLSCWTGSTWSALKTTRHQRGGRTDKPLLLATTLLPQISAPIASWVPLIFAEPERSYPTPPLLDVVPIDIVIADASTPLSRSGSLCAYRGS